MTFEAIACPKCKRYTLLRTVRLVIDAEGEAHALCPTCPLPDGWTAPPDAHIVWRPENPNGDDEQ